MELKKFQKNRERIESFFLNYSFPKAPPDWRIVQRSKDGIAYRRGVHSVIMSVTVELDDKLWLHVSVARLGQVPKYKILTEVKKLFIGEDKKAIQIFPEKSKHVNIHPFCLHLWHCIDGDDLPDFTQGGNTI